LGKAYTYLRMSDEVKTYVKDGVTSESRVALFLGNSGSGKSSMCAALTRNWDKFAVNDTLNSGTTICTHETKDFTSNAVWGTQDAVSYHITIVDSPGFGDTHKISDDDILEAAMQLIDDEGLNLTSIYVCFAYGKINAAEVRGVEALFARFGKAHISRIATVVLTRCESMSQALMAEKRQEVAEQDNKLRAIVEMFGGRLMFLGFPWQSSYDQTQRHQNLKAFNEESIERFRTELVRDICGSKDRVLRRQLGEKAKEDRQSRLQRLAAVTGGITTLAAVVFGVLMKKKT